MAVNRNWVKTDGRHLEYAPTWLRTDAGIVVNPTDEQYLAAGWLKNALNAPEARDGMIYAVYAYDEVTPPPRVFSKLYLILALKKRGLYEQFKEMIESAGLDDLWIAANELNEGYEGFDSFVAQAKTALGLTDAEVEEILGEAVAR